MTTALLSFAHPDDETIFAGSLMLAHPDWHWTWLCATSSWNTVRGAKLEAAKGEFIQAGVEVVRLEHLALPDGPDPMCPDGWANTLQRRIQRVADEAAPWDIAFTHGRRGDYGHPHHMATEWATREAIADHNLFEFVCSASSGIGLQWDAQFGKNTRWYNSHPHKQTILKRVYQQELDAIEVDRFYLYRWAMDGVEGFGREGGEWPTS